MIDYKILPLVAYVLFLLLEVAVPLQSVSFSKLKRQAVNLLMGTTGYMISAPISILLMSYCTTLNRGMGINAIGTTELLKVIISLLILDCSIYYWHRMNHLVPLLWRFHSVHHLDTEMDTSTAFRFHFGELVLSSGYRSIVIIIFGVSIEAIVIFEVLVTTNAIFHHANLKLPRGFEAALNYLLVTPRMHQLHHSRAKAEMDSNYGALLPLWDKLNKTYTPINYVNNVKLGVTGHNDQSEQTLPFLLYLPFKKK